MMINNFVKEIPIIRDGRKAERCGLSGDKLISIATKHTHTSPTKWILYWVECSQLSHRTIDVTGKQSQCAWHAIARTLHSNCSTSTSVPLCFSLANRFSLDIRYATVFLFYFFFVRNFEIFSVAVPCVAKILFKFVALSSTDSENGGTKFAVHFGCWKRLQNANGQSLSESGRCSQRLGSPVDRVM